MQQYNPEEIEQADVLYVPICIRNNQKFPHELIADLAKSGKEVAKFKIFLPFANFNEEQENCIAYYDVKEKIDAKRIALLEAKQNLFIGSDKQLAIFLGKMQEKFAKVVLIMQLTPSFKYCHEQFVQLVCIRQVNSSLKTIQQLENIADMQQLSKFFKSNIAGKQVSGFFEKIDLNKYGVVVSLSNQNE